MTLNTLIIFNILVYFISLKLFFAIFKMKYYVESGGVKVVLTAPNELTACARALQVAITNTEQEKP